jgi:ATP synthase protein I
MVSALVKPGRQLAKRLLLLQIGVVFAAAIFAMLSVNVKWGISALVGGGIFIFAHAVFAVCAFLFSGARKAKLVMATIYGGEVLKILITAILFVAVYLYGGLAKEPLQLTYLLALGVNAFAPVFLLTNNK